MGIIGISTSLLRTVFRLSFRSFVHRLVLVERVNNLTYLNLAATRNDSTIFLLFSFVYSVFFFIVESVNEETMRSLLMCKLTICTSP